MVDLAVALALTFWQRPHRRPAHPPLLHNVGVHQCFTKIMGNVPNPMRYPLPLSPVRLTVSYIVQRLHTKKSLGPHCAGGEVSVTRAVDESAGSFVAQNGQAAGKMQVSAITP